MLEPLLRIREMVPLVVGFQVRVTGCPAVAERPEVGMEKGLAVEAARARRGDERIATSVEREKYIFYYPGVSRS